MAKKTIDIDLDPPHNRTPTSRAAAESAKQTAPHQRAVVLDYIRKRGGATREEVALGLGLPVASVCPRVWELLKTGYLKETRLRRKTVSGKSAVVVVARKK